MKLDIKNMDEKYIKTYFESNDKFIWLYYHILGGKVENLIILNTLNGEIIQLTKNNPTFGLYHLLDSKFFNEISKGHEITRSEFNSLLKNLPNLDLMCDRYIKDSYFITSDSGEKYPVVDYIYFHGEWPERQIRIMNGKMKRFTKKNPILEDYHMCDQPFSIMGYKQSNFISREEFEEVWNRCS